MDKGRANALLFGAVTSTPVLEQHVTLNWKIDNIKRLLYFVPPVNQHQIVAQFPFELVSNLYIRTNHLTLCLSVGIVLIMIYFLTRREVHRFSEIRTKYPSRGNLCTKACPLRSEESKRIKMRVCSWNWNRSRGSL